MVYKCASLLFVVAFIGCAKQPEPTGVIPAHQLKALEKAKAVEGLIKDKGEQHKQLLEE
ncbi:hypothetical protein [Marinagarivorans cellulosilyticus]|uniref:hypothetical protein n=1 Tax=Marinagarivorans cellulosilyticus TaxID=2721545 RepID=UPI001F26A481|nr:hypothetical protein [Marinagarivorans cellulosilyticus]